MSEGSAGVRLERDGPVASLILDSGDLNLFGAEIWEALQECVDEVASSDARCLVWRAEGRIFSGGVDVDVFQRTVDEGDADRHSSLIQTIRKLESIDIPALALVHGLCLTAGLEIALGCDMLWASRDAKFGLVEAVVGLTPGAGGTQRMAERAGPARAAEFVMSGDLFDAETLERWNVVNRVLDTPEELQEKGMRFAHRLGNGPTVAHGATKRIIRGLREGGINGADDVTPGQFADLFASEDLQQAVRTFLDKGPGNATFNGR